MRRNCPKTGWLLTAAVAVGLMGCGHKDAQSQTPKSGWAIPGGPGDAFTQVNLRPDEGRKRMYSVNYLQAGFIPLCSRVTIHEVNTKYATFTVHQTGRPYTYYFHDTMVESIPVHMGAMFGPSCDPPPPGSMSETDLDGIRKGEALEGMSKQAVIYALGYPPRHATANLEADEWTYWRSRFNRMKLTFKDGRVAQIRE